MATHSDERRRPDGRPETSRARMTDATRDLMMATLLRNLAAFEHVRSLLKIAHIKPVSLPLAVLWAAVNHFYDEQYQLPDQHMLLACVTDMMAESPSMLTEPEFDELQQFVSWAFGLDPAKRPLEQEIYRDWAIKRVKLFLEERFQIQLRDNAIIDDMMISSLPEQSLRIAEEVASLSALDGNIMPMPVPDDWLVEPVRVPRSTGVGFVDSYMGGGTAGHEVYGLLGPFGSCKSTIAYMLSVNAAKYAYSLTAAPDYDGRPTIAFHFSYEDEMQDMRHRGVGYCAGIPMSTMTTITIDNMHQRLSSSDNLKEYEKLLYQDAILNKEPVMGEMERFQHAKQILNNHIFFADMVGTTVKGVGGGGWSEISQMISSELRRRNARCGLIVIDYIGAMVMRYMSKNELELEYERHLIKAAGMEAKTRLCSVYDCPAFLLHQLSGEENTRGPSAVADHSGAGGSKSWGENMDFCFSVGKPNMDNLALFGCTKRRRVAPRKPTVIKIDGENYQVLDVDKNYVLENKQIVSRASANTVFDEDQQQPRRLLGYRSLANLEPDDSAVEPDAAAASDDGIIDTTPPELLAVRPAPAGSPVNTRRLTPATKR